MLGKGKSISNAGGLVDYTMKKDNLRVCEMNGVSFTKGDKVQREFELTQKQNTRCKNNSMSFVVSPYLKDG